jgi:hypothetical protein
MMILRTVSLMFLGLWVPGSAVFSQGVCVPRALKVHSIQGYVLWKADEKPMPGMNVELLSFDPKMTRLAEVKSDKSGFFEINTPISGRYWLRTKNDQIPGITVEVQVKKKALSKNKLDYICFNLSLEPARYCMGSTVRLMQGDPAEFKPK